MSRKKYATVNVEHIIEIGVSSIAHHMHNLDNSAPNKDLAVATLTTTLNKDDPEARLTLTVMKANFGVMRIIGQFNLGFILGTPTNDRVSHLRPLHHRPAR